MTKCQIRKNGAKLESVLEWVDEDGTLSRDGGPARIRADGSMEWLKDGRYHRPGRPARIDSNGSLTWYVRGLLHRANGPAVVTQPRVGRGKMNIIFYCHSARANASGPSQIYEAGDDAILCEWRNDQPF